MKKNNDNQDPTLEIIKFLKQKDTLMKRLAHKIMRHQRCPIPKLDNTLAGEWGVNPHTDESIVIAFVLESIENKK